jgi:protein-disulfide isomerase
MEKQQLKVLGTGVAIGLVLGAIGVWVVSKPQASSAGRASCFLSGTGEKTVLATVDGKEISSLNLPQDMQQTFLQIQNEHLRRLTDLSNEVAVRYSAAKEQSRSSDFETLPSFSELMEKSVKDSDVREFFERNQKSFPKMEFSKVEAMLRKHLEQQKQASFVQEALRKLKNDNRLASMLPIPCGPTSAVSIPATAPKRGQGDKVEVAFLSDYQCGTCRYLKASLDRVLEQNQDRMTLIQVMHPGKPDSTNEFFVRGAFCANKQGDNDKFWGYHNAAYFTPVQYDASGKVQDVSDIKKAAVETAKRVGLDMAAFETCLSSKDAENYASENREYFAKIKLDQTPAFFLNGKAFAVPPQLNVDEFLIEIMNEASPAKPTPKAEATKAP